MLLLIIKSEVDNKRTGKSGSVINTMSTFLTKLNMNMLLGNFGNQFFAFLFCLGFFFFPPSNVSNNILYPKLKISSVVNF